MRLGKRERLLVRQAKLLASVLQEDRFAPNDGGGKYASSCKRLVQASPVVAKRGNLSRRPWQYSGKNARKLTGKPHLSKG